MYAVAETYVCSEKDHTCRQRIEPMQAKGVDTHVSKSDI